MNNRRKAKPNLDGPTPEALAAGLESYFKTADAYSVELLCRGGASLWASADDLQRDEFARLQRLGDPHDLAVRRYAHQNDLVLVLRTDGIGDNFTFEDDEHSAVDAEVNPVEPAFGELYTTARGRSLLLELDTDFDGVIDRLNEYLGHV